MKAFDKVSASTVFLPASIGISGHFFRRTEMISASEVSELLGFIKEKCPYIDRADLRLNYWELSPVFEGNSNHAKKFMYLLTQLRDSNGGRLFKITSANGQDSLQCLNSKIFSEMLKNHTEAAPILIESPSPEAAPILIESPSPEAIKEEAPATEIASAGEEAVVKEEAPVAEEVVSESLPVSEETTNEEVPVAEEKVAEETSTSVEGAPEAIKEEAPATEIASAGEEAVVKEEAPVAEEKPAAETPKSKKKTS